MKYKKILLCIPPFMESVPTAPFAGVGYMSEYLSSKGVEHEVVDMTLGHSEEELFRIIKEFNPDILGFFLMTSFYKRSYALIDKVKKKFDLPCVVGGPHISTFRKNFMNECSADFAIKLEGELTLMELLEGTSPESIKGLIYRKDKKILENEDRSFIKDLDSLPFPKYKKFELDRYKDKVIPIVTSRGCPYQCIYCPVKAAIGMQFRMRSAKNIFNEIKYWHDKGYRKFYFQDDNFTLIKKRVMDLCKMIYDSDLEGLILNCPNGVRADKVDREILLAMKKVGFKSIAFGVEGGNDKVLKALKKGETMEEIETKIKLACDLGFDVALFFLIGAPGETEKDVEDSFNLALRYPIVDVFFYGIVPYPETELYEWVLREDLLLKDPENYLNSASAFADEPFYETKELSKKKRIELLNRGKLIGRKIRRRGIVRRARERYGFLGHVAGLILSSSFSERYILQNKLFLRAYTKYLSMQAKKKS